MNYDVIIQLEVTFRHITNLRILINLMSCIQLRIVWLFSLVHPKVEILLYYPNDDS